MKSPVVKRSIVIAGHKTSVSLEDAFWKGLKEIAGGRDATLSELVASIDADRQHGNLSSALRLFVLDFYRNQLSEEIGLQAAPRAGAPPAPHHSDRVRSGCRWCPHRPYARAQPAPAHRHASTSGRAHAAPANWRAHRRRGRVWAHRAVPSG